MDSKTISRAAWIVPSVLLVAAIGEWPYGYYQFLRFVVCGACLFLAYSEFKTQNVITVWAVAITGTALVFNPLVPLRLSKSIWPWLDVAAAGLLIAHMIRVHYFKPVGGR